MVLPGPRPVQVAEPAEHARQALAEVEEAKVEEARQALAEVEEARVDSVVGGDSVGEEDNPDSEGREEVCRAILAWAGANRRRDAATSPELPRWVGSLCL